ncbi:unnamed protein product [Orchesella dallaii]|uniref:N-acetylgalactosaminide beta-1,3-galactosyltransferase n=1 Tax=Orchesella dallaii TaxID=48710 RepID=A0ABP1QJV7_9HEXA
MLKFKPKLRVLFLAAKSRYIWLGLLISVFFIILITTMSNRGLVDYTSHAHISSIPQKSFHNVDAEALFAKLLTPPAASINPSVKILCYILLSRSKVRTAMLIKETWGSHCDKLLFFGGYEYPELPVTFINATEGYENLWGKAKAALLYLLKNPYFKEYQYFLKADDDTFVIVENLREFIHNSSLSLDKPVWFGFKLKHKRMQQGYMSGGAGYVFNYAALTRVGTFLSKSSQQVYNAIGDCNVDSEYGVEDLELGKCFLHAGVKSINTTDENGGERFLPLSYDVLLNGAISSFHWIWGQAWNRVRTGERCCSVNLISMHEISPNQLKLLYHLLYKLKINR